MDIPHYFSRNDLPLLGIVWRYFGTEREATAFAKWAVRETVHDQYPCDAYISFEEDNAPHERYVVTVKNW